MGAEQCLPPARRWFLNDIFAPALWYFAPWLCKFYGENYLRQWARNNVSPWTPMIFEWHFCAVARRFCALTMQVWLWKLSAPMGAEQCLPLSMDQFWRDCKWFFAFRKMSTDAYNRCQLWVVCFLQKRMQVPALYHSPLGGYASTHPVLFTFRRLSKNGYERLVKKISHPKNTVLKQYQLKKKSKVPHVTTQCSPNFILHSWRRKVYRRSPDFWCSRTSWRRKVYRCSTDFDVLTLVEEGKVCPDNTTLTDAQPNFEDS